MAEKTLSNYKIGKILGKGGFGTVYSGFTKNNVPVAIKEVLIEKVSQWYKIGREKVPLEIVLLSKVCGISGVIKLIDWFKTNQTVKDFIEGVPSSYPTAFILILERPENCVDLFDYVGARGRLHEDIAKKFFKEIFLAVKGCFDKGIVHRDVKDENVIVVFDNKMNVTGLKLIDFGSATFVKKNDFTVFEGTKIFAPPEYFRDGKYDGEMSTVWSLGIFLYSMLCGNVPWNDETKIINASESDLWFPKCIKISKNCHHLIQMCLSENKYTRATLKDIYEHEWMKI
jgi:serine/threonine protein kinase